MLLLALSMPAFGIVDAVADEPEEPAGVVAAAVVLTGAVPRGTDVFGAVVVVLLEVDA
jgi:hypothetical protein